MSVATDTGQEHPIPDLGAGFHDLEDDGMAIFVWSKEQYREVLEVFAWFSGELEEAQEPTTERGNSLYEKFYRVDKLLHKRVRQSSE